MRKRETQIEWKRVTHLIKERHTLKGKETYIELKRGIHSETYIEVKRDLHWVKKRHTLRKRETYIELKRDLHWKEERHTLSEKEVYIKWKAYIERKKERKKGHTLSERDTYIKKKRSLNFAITLEWSFQNKENKWGFSGHRVSFYPDDPSLNPTSNYNFSLWFQALKQSRHWLAHVEVEKK